LAADIGGTFTDIAVFDERAGALTFGKVLSTPQRLVDGIDKGVEKAGSDFRSGGLFLHGSTVAINTILERTGARTALLITEGFRDIYEIGRINRPDAYNLFFRKHVPLIERALRFEVKERVLADGEIERPLDEDEIVALGKQLEALGIEACAILFLNCYARADHERAPGDLRKPVLRCSSRLRMSCHRNIASSSAARRSPPTPMWGRRRRYVGEIDRAHPAAGFTGSFLVAQSTGGLYEGAQAQIVRMLESGQLQASSARRVPPHAASRTLPVRHGRHHRQGRRHLGEPLTTGAALIGGYDQALPVQIAMMDIFEVGTGGGSIARVVEGGLRVGPQSAGASPGPACYGLGGMEPTVTDANLVLGRLGADRFLGGEMPLDVKAAEAALARVAGPLGMDATAVADGILRIAATAMSYAVKGVTTERGFDAGDFAPVAYGGAGPLHAVEVARGSASARSSSGAPGVFSAFGMLFSDLRYDYVRTFLTRLEEAPFDKVEALYTCLRTKAAPRLLTLRSSRRRSRSGAPPTCAMLGRSTPLRSRCRSACSRSAMATRSSGCSMLCMNCATAPRRRRNALRSSACAAPSPVSCASRRRRRSAKVNASRRLRHQTANGRSFSEPASCRRRHCDRRAPCRQPIQRAWR
jgi:N-methylhydantoinase A